MPATLDCVVGLGANLGDRARTLASAAEQLQRVGQIDGLSNVYENPAVGGPSQPDYLNAALRLRSPLSPEDLLAELLHIELLAGRERRVRWGPRTIDLDLLWIRETTVELPHLTVPHPRLVERAFALVPLLEVAPDARCPATLRPYSSFLGNLRPESLRLVLTAAGPPWHWSIPDA